MKTLQQFVQNLSCAQCQCGMRESEVEEQIQERIDQEKAALKEKIIAIRNRTFWDGEMNVSENGDFVRACNEILKLFNAETLK